jgi:hypothetical protein
MLSPTQARQLLILGRTGLALAWLSPVTMVRLLGFRNPQTDVSLPYLVRLFAARDAALGLMTALAPADRRRPALLIGVTVDAADLLAAVVMVKDRRVPRFTVVMSAVAAAGAVVLGLLASREA